MQRAVLLYEVRASISFSQVCDDLLMNPVSQPLTAPSFIAALEVDEHLVLLDESTGRIFLYNPIAKIIWHGASHLDLAELSSQLAEQFSEPIARVRDDVEQQVNDWLARGLIYGVDRAGRAVNSSEVRARKRSQRAPRTPALQWRSHIQGQVFEFAADSSMAAELLRRVLGETSDKSVLSNGRYEIIVDEGAGHVLLENGAERMCTDDATILVGAVYQAILERLHPRAEWLAIIHASAVAIDQAAAVFAAPSGSGKTTLVASLVRQGFCYLSDDFTAVTSEGAVVPWLVPLSVKQGSWPLVSRLYPHFQSAPVFTTKSQRARLLCPPHGSFAAEPAPLRMLIFSDYAKGSPARINPISHAEALGRLLNDRIWLGYPVTRTTVEKFLQWFRSIPVFELTYDDLREVSECLGSMLRKSKSRRT